MEETQQKGQNQYDDEIDLRQYWRVITKYKEIIIGLFLFSVILIFVVSLLMPKIYKGEVILRVIDSTSTRTNTNTNTNTNKELVDIVGKFSKDKRERIFPRINDLISDIKLEVLKNSNNKLNLIIESKDKNIILNAFNDFNSYVNNIDYFKKARELSKKRTKFELEEVNKSIIELSSMKKKMVTFNILNPIGFNPVDFYNQAIDLKSRKKELERLLKEDEFDVIRIFETPFIYKYPVKPTIFRNVLMVGVLSIFIGIFLVFVIEYIKRQKERKGQLK